MAEKDERFKCAWDGDIATFPDYVRKVTLAFEKTRRRRRRHLGPDLVSQLTGRAWVITQEIDFERLTKPDGARYLVQFLEDKLARVPVPDAGARAEELLVRLRRPQGMSMATWCATVRESYRKLQRALKRARPSSPTSPGGDESLVPSPSTLGRDRKSPMSPADSGSPSASPMRPRKGSKASVPEPEQMPTPERPSAAASPGDPHQAERDDDGRE